MRVEQTEGLSGGLSLVYRLLILASIHPAASAHTRARETQSIHGCLRHTTPRRPTSRAASFIRSTTGLRHRHICTHFFTHMRIYARACMLLFAPRRTGDPPYSYLHGRLSTRPHACPHARLHMRACLHTSSTQVSTPVFQHAYTYAQKSQVVSTYIYSHVC